jgi:stage II sporulation protein AA (anti-sigma F factor antagonist)
MLFSSQFGIKGNMMEIDTKKEKNATVVSVKGRLDAVSSPVFEKELAGLMIEGGKDFVIDFAQLDYISSAGLRVILATAKNLKKREGRLFLCSLQEMVREVFEVSGFTTIIPIHESVESALDQV